MSNLASSEEFKALTLEFVESIKDERYRTQVAYRCTLPNMPRGRWFLAHLIPCNGKILDLCGAHGHWGAYMQKMEGWQFDYTCLDYDNRHCVYGEDFFKFLELKIPVFTKHNVRAPLPFPDDVFDQVWFFACLFCLSGKRFKSLQDDHVTQILSEISRVLKSKKHLFFDIPITDYTSEDLTKLLLEAGLNVEVLDMYETQRPKQKFYAVICRAK